MIESPFVQYCEEMDHELIGQGLDAYRERAFSLWQKDPYYLTHSLIDDFTFRAKYQMNVIMSVEGEQGQYKSLYSMFWAYKLSSIFGQPFDMEKQLYVIPEDLDNGLRHSINRTTHLLDEQRRKNVGIGSQSAKFSLMDYEEQCRYTQKNIIYASPEVQEHAHYFVFRSYTHERVSNSICDSCKIQNECLSQEDKFKTLCHIPFFERIGYPKSMTFFLFTRRKIDKHEVLRGLVTVPMPTPETLMAYDVIKKRNIVKLESQEENSFKYIEDIINLFVQDEPKLIMQKGELTFNILKVQGELVKVPRDNRKFVIVNEKLMENYLYQYLKSRRKFTYHEIKLIIAGSRAKLIDLCAEKNAVLREERDELMQKTYIVNNP